MSVKTDIDMPADPSPSEMWTPGQPLPAFVTIGGVEVAIVAKADYLALVASRAEATATKIRSAYAASKGPPPGLSTIEKDAEVAEFLKDLFRGRMTLQALHAACVERFGKDRAPSSGRIGVFRTRVRSYQR